MYSNGGGEEGTERGSFAATALLLCSAAVAPLVMRAVLLADRVSMPGALDLRGTLSDLAVILGFVALLIPIARFSRVIAALLVVAWTLTHYANFETVRVLGAVASVRDLVYVVEPTFFFGSAIAISSPLLLVGCAALGVWLMWRGAPRASLLASAACALIAVVAVVAHHAWPFTAEHARWRQIDMVQENAEVLTAMAFGPEDDSLRFRDPHSAVLDLMPEMAADLSGEPILPMPRPGLNVLLVILESVSGMHVGTLAQDHGWRHHQSMPELDRIADANIAYSTFFTHQRRTNRGVYSILCGDLPTLLPGLAKMSSYVEGGRACLPQLLRDAGYETVYLQAAPLAFMMKDQFMPRAGFEHVYGRPYFDRHYAESRWGVDDRAMLEKATELIAELQDGEKPWFLTLLTVGTHHPFVFPEDFRPELITPEMRSLAYLDVAIGEFQRRLEKMGVPRDTLIVFTSDESSALTGYLSQSWSHLVVQTPDHGVGRVREAFGQMDLALSILDYLGLGELGGHLFGRSVFRRYETPRWIFFANTNLDYLGARTPEGDMIVCTNEAKVCRKQRPEHEFFSRRYADLPPDPTAFDLTKEMARRTVARSTKDVDQRTFTMMTDPTVVIDIPEGQPDQMIHGGQYVDMKVGEWIEVELEVVARGDPGAATTVVHYIRSRKNERIRRWMMPIEPGQTLKLHYTFAPIAPIDTVQTRSYATRRGDLPIELEFKVGRMTHHREGDTPEFGIQVLEKATLPAVASSN